MHVRPRRRTIRLLLPVLSVAALLAVCAGSALAAASSTPPHRVSLAGAWAGHYSGAYSGTFTLHWTLSNSKLTGSITLSNPRGKYTVTGSVHGSDIQFGAVGAGATYTGTVSGTSMSGRYKTGRTGGSWSAHKTS
jgi:opacity protein-like surface antigen